MWYKCLQSETKWPPADSEQLKRCFVWSCKQSDCHLKTRINRPVLWQLWRFGRIRPIICVQVALSCGHFTKAPWNSRALIHSFPAPCPACFWVCSSTQRVFSFQNISRSDAECFLLPWSKFYILVEQRWNAKGLRILGKWQEKE